MIYTKENGKQVSMTYQTISTLSKLVDIEQNFLDKYVAPMKDSKKKTTLLKHMSQVFHHLADAYDDIDCDAFAQAQGDADWIDEGCPKF